MSIGKNIKELRTKYGLSQKDLAIIAGVSDKAVSTWENGSKDPRMGTIQKIADHFGLQKSNIIEENGLQTNSPLPSLTAKDEHNIQKKLENILEGLTPDAGLAYYNDEEPMDDEDKELLRISLENTLRLAKQMAKQKFTPKKYRKE